MSKEINLKEADSWDKEELLNNIKYLEDRGRYEDAAPLREKAGLSAIDPAQPNPDLDVMLNQERSVTSRFGTNDTPEYDPGADQTVTVPGGSRQVGRTQDPTGEVGPHGANADQFVPDDDERNTKNRPETGETNGRAKAGTSGGGSKKASKKDGGNE